jgi:hypothetical protein
MVFLLDTHVLLWALDKPDRLPEEVLHYLETPDNEVYFSAVSILEIAIKTSLGTVNFSYSPEQIMQIARNRVYRIAYYFRACLQNYRTAFISSRSLRSIVNRPDALDACAAIDCRSALTPYSKLVWLI